MASFLTDNGGGEGAQLHLVSFCRMPEKLMFSGFLEKAVHVWKRHFFST